MKKDKVERMLDEIDLVIGSWSVEKLKWTVRRAKYYLRRKGGRPFGSIATDQYAEAVKEAGHNVKIKRRERRKEIGKARTDKGWQEKMIVAEIRGAPVLLAEYEQKTGRDVYEAVRRASKTLRRIRVK
jgi:hypothetical protein